MEGFCSQKRHNTRTSQRKRRTLSGKVIFYWRKTDYLTNTRKFKTNWEGLKAQLD